MSETERDVTLNGRAQGPILAVSACLLGESVRYDGTDKRDARVQGLLAPFFQFRPLCPEVGAGLGVPRPPVQLVRREGELRAVGVEDPDLDVTAAIEEFARRFDREDGVDGLVLKARSPSCALGSAPVGESEELADGLFAARVRTRRPWLPCIQEDQLDDLWLRLHFAERVWIGHGLRSGHLGCLRPSWVYRLKGRGPGGIDQDPARSLEEALSRPWAEEEITCQTSFLQDDPALPEAWRERLANAAPEADPARRLGLLLAALAALDGDERGEALFLAFAGLTRSRDEAHAPC